MFFILFFSLLFLNSFWFFFLFCFSSLFFFTPTSPCFILMSCSFPLFLNSFCLLLFFSCYFFHPCLFSQGRCILLFLLFLIFVYLFSFLPFYSHGLLFFPFFFLLQAYGHPPQSHPPFFFFLFTIFFLLNFFILLLFSFYSLLQVGCGHLGYGDE